MDALAADTMARDPHRFELVLRGRSGVGGIYDLFRRARRCPGRALRARARRPRGLMLEILAYAALAPACAAVMTAVNLAVFRAPPPRGRSAASRFTADPGAQRRGQHRCRARRRARERGVELEVLVLDDGSTDRTAQPSWRHLQDDARLRLLAAPPLPPGWSGKQHACHVLAGHARHPLLVFADADVRLSPDALARIAGLLERKGLDLVSGFPQEVTRTLSEALIVPLIHVLLLGYLPIWLARRLQHPAFAAGCGQLIAVRRDAYQRAGGHAAIRGSRHDGLMLPRAFRRAGCATDLFDATDLARCRMYRGGREVWQGFAKNATEGMAKPLALPVWTLLLGGGHVLPFLALLVALAAGSWPAVAASAVAGACVYGTRGARAPVPAKLAGRPASSTRHRSPVGPAVERVGRGVARPPRHLARPRLLDLSDRGGRRACRGPTGIASSTPCAARIATLVELIVRNGLPSASGLLRLGIALASSIGRLPFTATERAWTAFALHRARPMPPPIFIIGLMRSGTTHLHNLLAASGQFATVPPVLAGMPWEALGLARVLRPFVEQYLPEDRLIDRVRVQSDSPIEDEIALANMHALLLPCDVLPAPVRGDVPPGLLLDTGEEVARWQRTLRHYVGKMTELGAGRPLLLKNPGYSAQIGAIRALWPNARFVHIYRNPYVVFESTRRALIVLRELALQSHEHVPIDEVVLALYPRMMSRLLKEVDRLPSRTIVHVRFEELERDPLGQVERIYRSIKLDDYELARPRIEAYLHSIHDYSKFTYLLEGERRTGHRTLAAIHRPLWLPPARSRRDAA